MVSCSVLLILVCCCRVVGCRFLGVLLLWLVARAVVVCVLLLFGVVVR